MSNPMSNETVIKISDYIDLDKSDTRNIKTLLDTPVIIVDLIVAYIVENHESIDRGQELLEFLYRANELIYGEKRKVSKPINTSPRL